MKGNQKATETASQEGAFLRHPCMDPMTGAMDAWSYWRDAWQRSVLYWDVMRQRGNSYKSNAGKTVPHIFKFDFKLIMDGRELLRPVNYGLVQIVPPDGVVIDYRKRPFIVVDPRAGHGPGIGGFKAESEVGVALKAGHPCYFIGFLPEPVPGQTIEDIMNAEISFIERVIALHPEAEGRPAVIGNCQAGWAVMMLAAIRPELVGPILVAGSPLSYWAGVRGQNPMRYTGGLTGGSWMTALLGDLGHGKFDGAWIVSNFEGLNPANTYWAKQYNLYSKIDTEVERYLGFEEWWGGHVLLNAEEMQFIVDQLFIGNKLTAGEIITSEGLKVDLRNIKSPIIVFCSKGDNITPPQQALGWILDLYSNLDDIRAHGQTIVYAIHESIGHLGIFVSGGVAKKEHDKFASNIDVIDILPPGLYEAVITPKDPQAAGAELIESDYTVQFEMRDLHDIRALGGNDPEDDRRFETAARVSDINLGLYRMFMQPWIRATVSEPFASWLRSVHPLRLQYEMLSDANPYMRKLVDAAANVWERRQPVSADNTLLRAQEAMSRRIEQNLESYKDMRDRLREQMFHAIYGSRFLQALVGIGGSGMDEQRRIGTDISHVMDVSQCIEDLKTRMGEGGVREAAIRALIYIRMSEGAADERGVAFFQRMCEEHGKDIPLREFKQLVREQFLMLTLDEEHAIRAIPGMLATDKAHVADMRADLRKLIEAVGLRTDIGRMRFSRIDAMFAAFGGDRDADKKEQRRIVPVPEEDHPMRGHKNAGRTSAKN